MAHTKITKLQRLHVDVATTTGIANPARSGRTFIVLDGDLAAALEAVRAAKVEHGGRLNTAERRGLRTIERRLEQAKPEYVTVTDHEPPEQANEPISEQAAPRAELLAAVAETGVALAAGRERAAARAAESGAESAAAHAAGADVAAAQGAAMTTAQQHLDAQAPTIGELRAMTFDARRAAVIGMSPVACARLLAAMGRDEIESFLDDAVIGIGPNNDIDATFRTQILDRYAEIDPDKATAARAAAEMRSWGRGGAT